MSGQRDVEVRPEIWHPSGSPTMGTFAAADWLSPSEDKLRTMPGLTEDAASTIGSLMALIMMKVVSDGGWLKPWKKSPF